MDAPKIMASRVCGGAAIWWFHAVESVEKEEVGLGRWSAERGHARDGRNGPATEAEERAS